MERTKNQQFFIYLGVIAVMIFTLAPIILLIIATLSSGQDLNSKTLHFLPSHWTLKNFTDIFTAESNDASVPPFMQALKNSIIVSLSTTFLTLIIAILASYAISRFRFKGQNGLLMSTLGFRMVPEIALLIPLFVIFARFGAINNLSSLILIYTAFNLPFAIWMLQGFFRSIPKSMEESAYLDGVSSFGVLIRFILPISLSGIIATGIFVLLASWDEFMFASIFTSTYDSKTITVAISEFSKRGMVNFGMQITGGLIASLPPIILALIFQKFIVSGLSEGSEKG
ncbi:ABC transporter permease subunit [Terrilactibacillus sp. BCM23-1]|uniref:ABC transporter permease subunit n=1 Tax=Terrilactibacillus tamarindi TaxID=2599694 RepID=A0A6N8CVM8_9BACI|nr:carbohydrate ABC transporter permease [Terrilactibacillus tamarindi]MTT32366.1 ABC transporter permease subunit [Terrilactibacillus tamarindi]